MFRLLPNLRIELHSNLFVNLNSFLSIRRGLILGLSKNCKFESHAITLTFAEKNNILRTK